MTLIASGLIVGFVVYARYLWAQRPAVVQGPDGVWRAARSDPRTNRHRRHRRPG